MKFLIVTIFLCGLAPFAYAQTEQTRPPLTFHGYHCTVDCSGHKAGFEWAQRKNITAADQCGGKSNSFIEGCIAWVQAQEEPPAENAAETTSPAPSSSPEETE